MLQTSYPTQDAVPENLRGAYVRDPKTGTWVLDRLSEDHPVIVHKVKLEGDNSTLRSSNAGLKANEGKLPDGTVAIAAADKVYVDQLKPLGEPKEIKKKVDEYPALLKEKQARALETKLEEVAEVMGWDPKNTKLLLTTITDLPELEIVAETQKDEEGKDKIVKKVVAKVKNESSGEVERKSFNEVVETNSRLKALEPSLKVQENNSAGIGKTGSGSSTKVTPQSPSRGHTVRANTTKDEKPSASQNLIKNKYQVPGQEKSQAKT